MSEQTLLSIKIIAGLLGIFLTAFGFIKIIREKAALEADLRNEIKNLKEDNEEMKDLVKDMIKEFRDISLKQQAQMYLEERVKNTESINKEIRQQMMQFGETLTQIRITLERKLDRAQA